MKQLGLGEPGRKLTVLCLGAHSDDIEIGAGGTILSFIAAGVELDVHWWVLSSEGERKDEARAAAANFLEGAASVRVACGDFKDGYFPYEGHKIKGWIETLSNSVVPDVIFTHRRDDAHQDHREICKLTWNTFRAHLILEYEIPKWDGDVGQPNFYMPLTSNVLERKLELLSLNFATQRGKDWFDGDTFRGLARLRGMECRAPERFAEAFTLRKAVFGCLGAH
ncbi:MAG: PIG-L family deacetylase [Hyphomicrobiaceae bacterium]